MLIESLAKDTNRLDIIRNKLLLKKEALDLELLYSNITIESICL